MSLASPSGNLKSWDTIIFLCDNFRQFPVVFFSSRGNFQHRAMETSFILNQCESSLHRAFANHTYHMLNKYQKILLASSELIRFFNAPRSAIEHRKSALMEGSIPTCVLLTGVNLPDHDDFFRLLRNNLVDKISVHVASLKSTECQNPKTLVMRTISQLIKKV